MNSLRSYVSMLTRTARSAAAIMVSAVLIGVLWFGYSIWSGYVHRRATLKKKKQVISEQRKKLNRQKKKLAEQSQKIDELHALIRKKDDRIQQLETQIRLLKVNRRVARLRILSQTRNPDTGVYETRVKFVELDREGRTIGTPQQYTVRGKIVYVDGWIVKFKDKYVQQSKLPRSSSVILFHRIYGQKQPPETGARLDRPGSVPLPYRRENSSNSLIENIFQDFWTVANDPALQEELGIRAAHGTAGYIKAVPGHTYHVSLRASGDVSIVPAESTATSE